MAYDEFEYRTGTVERANEELKKCPFCGDRARIQTQYSGRRDRYYIYAICEGCSAKSRTFSSVTDPAKSSNRALELVVDFWNKREGVESNEAEN